GSPSSPVGFHDQDYAQLRDTCLHTGGLFVDSTFPPNGQSLGDLPDLSSWREAQVEWLRPHVTVEILKLQNIKEEPVFCLDGASRFDFRQGIVGNCWFLAAISALTFHKNVLEQVVPIEQSFDNYAGIFHFRFWRFGKWVDVVVDDLLPVLDKTLLSVRSNDGYEFWAALLEKAYAKVCGSYSDMNSGLPSEACKDFCGGVNMTYELKDAHAAGHDEKLWLTLERATKSHAMICCGTSWKGDMLLNTVSKTGLVDAHAYAVTGVTEVNCFGCDVKLVRLMNPWGRQEWNGKWSDGSSEWDKLSAEDQKKCNKKEDGEFWMELEDFCYYYQMLFICCENPSFIDRDVDCGWKYQTYEGSWVAGKTAGGDLSDYTFHQNPQYRIQVAEENEEEKGSRNVLFSLMQKPQRSRRNKSRFFPIGLNIFKTPDGQLESVFFKNNQTVKEGQMYYFERELTEFYNLEPGEYVIPTDEEEEQPMEESAICLLFNRYADQKLFQSADKNKNRYLNEEELKNALSAAGMQLSDGAVNLLMYRYSDSAIMPYLSLNGFIPFMMRMDRTMDVIKENLDKHTHLSFEEVSLNYTVSVH
ncbi:unnamed protein product, partial [Tetraodon nigroviridis]